MKSLKTEHSNLEHPVKNLEKIFIQQGWDFSEELGKKMISLENLQQEDCWKKVSNNAIFSTEVRKLRPNEITFIKVRGQFPSNFEENLFLIPRPKSDIIPIKVGKKENADVFYLHAVSREKSLNIQPNEILAQFSNYKTI